MPDDAPVMTAHGPNLRLSIRARISVSHVERRQAARRDRFSAHRCAASPSTPDGRHQACRGRGAATRHTPVEAGNIARTPNAIHPITSSLRLYVSWLTNCNGHFARPASGFAAWGCGFSPPGVSPPSNPTLEALGLRRHKAGVMKGMSQDRNALHGGKQVHGKAVGVFPLPECPKLALDPGQVMSEDLGRTGGDRAARLVEFGAKRPDRAAALCQELLVLEAGLDAGAKPILGRSSFVPSLPLRGQLR